MIFKLKSYLLLERSNIIEKLALGSGMAFDCGEPSRKTMKEYKDCCNKKRNKNTGFNSYYL